jgi:hypothetical protein
LAGTGGEFLDQVVADNLLAAVEAGDFKIVDILVQNIQGSPPTLEDVAAWETMYGVPHIVTATDPTGVVESKYVAGTFPAGGIIAPNFRWEAWDFDPMLAWLQAEFGP